MQIYLNIFLLFITHLFSPSKHETYVSITEIMAKENEALEISIELIAHDFEYVYKKEMNKSIKSIFNEKKNITILMKLKSIWTIIFQFLKRTQN